MNSRRLHSVFRSALIPVLMALMFASPARGAVVLSRQDAVNVLVSQLGLGGSTLAWCPYVDYGSGPGFEGALPTGTTVRPYYLNTQPFPGNTVTLTNPMYLFFVDDDPLACFTHRVRYVFMDATVAVPTLAGGGIVIQTEGWWPVIQRPGHSSEEIFGQNTRYSPSPGGYQNTDGLVFGQIPNPKPEILPSGTAGSLPPSTQAEPNACAIILTGRAPGAPRSAEKALDNTADSLRTELLGRGVPAGRIQDKRNGSKDDLRAAVQALCAASPACDKIYVFILSHGSIGSLELTKDNNVSADSLCKILEPLGKKSVPVCMLLGACYSGSLVGALRPKFPTGVIITATGRDSACYAGGVLTDFGAHIIDTQVHFPYLFLRCWRSAAADTDGVAGVSWPEAYKWVCKNSRLWEGLKLFDVKSPMPTLNGLCSKYERWQAPTSGTWYVDWWRDFDEDGKFDHCDWLRDDDCDGTFEVRYQNEDRNEDGKPEMTICTRDSTDDGVPETRYTFRDPNGDGVTDSLKCESFDGSNWTLTAQIPRRVGNFNISPSSGSRGGGQSIQISGIGTTWANAGVKVFVGSDCKNIVLNNPSLISAVTKGYLIGPRNVIVADFNSGSPSYGFVEVANAYNYTGEVFVDSVDPASGPCNTARLVTIHGTAFSSSATVRVEGIPVSSTWVNSTTMTATVPSSFCATMVDVTVDNPGNGEATLTDGYEYLPAADVTAPTITCPGNLVLAAGGDGLARTMPSFQATGNDNAGPPTIVRDNLGALCIGTHLIKFEAFDASNNRTTCTASVQVTGAAGGPIVINEIRTDQIGTDVDEYFELAGPIGASLAGLTYIVIGDAAGTTCGTIESVTPLSAYSIGCDGVFAACRSSTPALTGYDATGVTSILFENTDRVTHMLVSNFSGSLLQGLDTNNDGNLDVTPWTSQVDCVALIDANSVDCVAGREHVYCGTTVGPDGVAVPGHVYRCPDTSGWLVGPFDLALGVDSPGTANPACISPLPLIFQEQRTPCVPGLNVAVTVTDSASNVNFAVLTYSVNGGPPSNLSMPPIGGNKWRAVIPGQPSNATRVSYFVTVTNSSGSDVGPNQGYFVGVTPIGTLRVNDANGVNVYRNFGVSVVGNVTVQQGVFSPINTDFQIQDATGGVNVFQSGVPGPAMALGDNLSVSGVIDQFNGKLEISTGTACPGTPMIVINGPGSVPAPLLVNSCMVNESIEGRLIRMQYPTVAASPGTILQPNVNYAISDCASDSTDLFIDADTNIDGTMMVTNRIDVIGICAQFDATSPFIGRMEIVPRSTNDIVYVQPSGIGNDPSLFQAHLFPNAPNPFRSTTRIVFRVPLRSDSDSPRNVLMSLYDVTGRQLATLLDEPEVPGMHEITFDAGDFPTVRSGIYFFMLEVDGRPVATRKVTLNR